MKKQFKLILLIFGLAIVFASCASKKKIIYFQEDKTNVTIDSIINFEPQIQIGDILKIDVTAVDIETAMPFNLTKPSQNGANTNSNEMGYLVDIEGKINFPVLGKLKIDQMTRIELMNKLTSDLSVYLKDPIVNIQIVNFKITVLGEVKSPGTYTIVNERVSIVEAIGMAGDLQMLGKRNPVTLIREQNGERIIVTFDFTNRELFNSPYYYLAQNDVIYVEPNSTRIRTSVLGPNLALILSGLTLLLTLTAVTGVFN
jgi:polysaccharide export outer membrane protein